MTGAVAGRVESVLAEPQRRRRPGHLGQSQRRTAPPHGSQGHGGEATRQRATQTHPPLLPQLPALGFGSASPLAPFLVCVTPSPRPLFSPAPVLATRDATAPPSSPAGRRRRSRSAACASLRTGGEPSLFALLDFSVFFAALGSGCMRRTDRFFLSSSRSIKNGCLQLRLV